MKTKEMLGKALSLSCVENYFLTWCEQNNIDFKIMYSHSFIKINKLYDDFISNCAKYENYPEIPRIMETAKKHGFIKQQIYADFNENVIDKHISKGDLVLIEVNETFFKGISRMPWRADHFIWLSECVNKEYEFYSNYPLSVGKLTQDKIKEVFSNKVLVYSKRKKLFEKKVKSDSLIQLNKIIHNGAKEILLPAKSYLINIRNMLGILKISRKRIMEWFSYMNSCRHLIFDDELKIFLAEYTSFLDKLFLKIEASILRKKIDIEKLQENFDVIIAREKKLSSLIKMRRIIDEQIKYY